MSDPEVTSFGLSNYVNNWRDTLRYRWLASQFAKGNETYLPESISSKEELDAYIDKALLKEMIDNNRSK